MHKYRTYGLRIDSEMCIPELAERVEGSSDVTIHYGQIEKPNFESKDQHSIAKKVKEGHIYYIRNIGGIRVEDGKKVTVCPLDEAESRGFRFLVSGIGLGLLLHQRGLVVLHASAIAIQDQVFGFIGPKGMGKSTTAAAFHAHGRPLVTDDLLALDFADNQVTVRPGPPHLKLYPQSIEGSLNEDPDQIPKVDPQGTKRSYCTQNKHPLGKLPLRCLYVLDYWRDKDESCSPIHSQEMNGNQACMEVIRNSYVLRLLSEEAISKRHLKKSADIASAVSIRRLYREKSLERISDIVSHVEKNHFG